MPIRFERLGGKTTKRSHFGSKLTDQKESTLVTSLACEKAKLHYHILDSERIEHYLQTDEIVQLTSSTDKLRTILTVSSRHSHSDKYLREIAPLLKRTRRVGLNFVAGNPQYLSQKEVKSSSTDTLTHLTTLARKLLPKNEIFIGTEGLLKLSVSLAKSYDLNPFFLLDRNLRHDLSKTLKEIPLVKTAVYAPYLVSEQKENLAKEILTLLGPYIIRRKWVQKRMVEHGHRPSVESVKKLIKLSNRTGETPEEKPLGRLLLECSSELAIYGDPMEVAEGVRNLFDRGISIVVGSPMKDCQEQVIAFGRCVTMASQH